MGIYICMCVYTRVCPLHCSDRRNTDKLTDSLLLVLASWHCNHIGGNYHLTLIAEIEVHAHLDMVHHLHSIKP